MVPGQHGGANFGAAAGDPARSAANPAARIIDFMSRLLANRGHYERSPDFLPVFSGGGNPGLARTNSPLEDSDEDLMVRVQAGDEHWLIDLSDTGEILPVPALVTVPLTRDWFRGIANVRGSLYGVLDLSRFHRGAPIVPAGQARLLLLGARHGVNSALLVSRASGLAAGSSA